MPNVGAEPDVAWRGRGRGGGLAHFPNYLP